MNTRPQNQAEGERLKAGALEIPGARRDRYVLRGRRALLERLLRDGVATADDVRDAVELPPGIGPKCFGAVPGPLRRAGIIAPAGFCKTCRPAAYARPVIVWTLADREAAQRWLEEYPDLPDPGEHDQGNGSQRVLFPIRTTNEATPAVGAAGAAME